CAREISDIWTGSNSLDVW
nr:immunoglobulin heavy chain junction region [Macaca mulatta]